MPTLVEKLRKKSKLKVGFYIYDETKWKCQSVYDLMEKDDIFEPIILVSRTDVKDTQNPSWQPEENLEKVYSFFKNKNMNVEYAYNKGFIPFKNFDLDIIIYQHPWYVETSQGPLVCSEFAITCYVPYYFPTTTAPIDYYLRFHNEVQNYYVFDEITRKVYCEKMSNKGKNVKVTGQPFLDYFHTECHSDSRNERQPERATAGTSDSRNERQPERATPRNIQFMLRIGVFAKKALHTEHLNGMANSCLNMQKNILKKIGFLNLIPC